MTCVIERSGDWKNEDCIHYSELGATYIKYLEDFLVSLERKMKSRAVVVDTSEIYKARFPSWQYPPKHAWVIRKSDLLKEMECQVTSATYAEAR